MEQRDLIAVKQRYGIIGHDATLDRAIDIAVQVAKTNLTVLITGESGVGKENFSKIIHDNSPRKHGRYIAVNCGAIPEGTIDSELFGHEKGAFTGAVDSRKGYFEEANGGTIFLDEVVSLYVWAHPNRKKPMSEWWPQPMSIFHIGSVRASSVRICTTASTRCRFMCRPCAIAKMISYCCSPSSLPISQSITTCLQLS